MEEDKIFLKGEWDPLTFSDIKTEYKPDYLEQCGSTIRISGRFVETEGD